MTKPSSPAQAHVQSPVQAPASAREARERADLAHWLSISARATDPTTARLILDHLDEHAQLREQYVGVYLVAKETVERDRIRYAKAMRRGQAVAATARMLWKACTGLVRVIQSLPAATGVTARKAAPAATHAAMPTQAPSPSTASSFPAVVPSAPVVSKPSAQAKSPTLPAGIRAPARRPTMHSRAVQPRRLSPHRLVPVPQAGTLSGALAFPTIIDPFAS